MIVHRLCSMGMAPEVRLGLDTTLGAIPVSAAMRPCLVAANRVARAPRDGHRRPHHNRAANAPVRVRARRWRS